MTPDSRYWRQRQVCVVGGTGFLGWHLARQLTEAGAQVRIFGLPPRNDHPLIHQSDIEVIFGDVTECAALALALDSSATVFNTAGVVAATRADRDRFFTVHRAAI